MLFFLFADYQYYYKANVYSPWDILQCSLLTAGVFTVDIASCQSNMSPINYTKITTFHYWSRVNHAQVKASTHHSSWGEPSQTHVRFCCSSVCFLSVAPHWSIVRSFVYCRYRQRVIRANTTKLWHVSEHFTERKATLCDFAMLNMISLIENTV